MKLLQLSALYVGLTAVFLSSSLSVSANPNDQKIQYQKKMFKEETYSNKKATPVVEKRPAVTTKKTLNRQDARNPMPDPKSEMIEKKQKVTQDEIEGAKQA